MNVIVWVYIYIKDGFKVEIKVVFSGSIKVVCMARVLLGNIKVEVVVHSQSNRVFVLSVGYS